MARFVTPNPPFFDETQDPLQPVRSGWLVFYVSGTTSPKAVYLEAIENNVANDAQGRVPLDNDGRLPFPVYYSGLASIELRRADLSLVWRLDNIEAGGGSGDSASADAQFLEFRYKRAAAQPATPTGDNPAGWSTIPQPNDGTPLWITQGLKVVATGALVGAWSMPVQLSGDPGSSGVLNVEFSVDGSTNWHPTFAPGDIFMRIDQGAGFGPAIKIVGEDGNDGDYFSNIFRRSATLPATPPANDPNPIGWSDAPPTTPANQPLWLSVAKISADGTTVLVPWTVPINIRGDDGQDGQDGISLEVQYSPNGTDSWHGPPLVATDRFIRQRVGPTAPWGPSMLFIGEDGQDGPFTSLIFRRSVSQPATPTGANPSGWSDGAPSGSDPLWLSTALKSDANTLLTGWTTPRRISGDSISVQYSPNGSTGWHDPPYLATDNFMRQRLGDGSWSNAIRIVGENGVDGEFFDFRFLYAASQPPTPTGNNPAGWSDNPATATGTGPLWMIRGRKTAQGNLIGNWSIPVQIEGEIGLDSVDTEHIVDDAVTVRATSTGTTKTGNNTWQELASITLTLDHPGDVQIAWAISQGYGLGSAPAWGYRIIRDFSTIKSRESMGAVNDQPSSLLMDEGVSAGSHTWRLEWKGEPNGQLITAQGTIVLLGVLR